MFRIVAFFVFILLLCGLILINIQKQNNSPSVSVPTPTAKIQPTQPPQKMRSLFVPYWADFDEEFVGTPYDRLIYFGIQPSTQGIVKTEPGYTNITGFKQRMPSGTTHLLTLRMVSTDTNVAILKNKASWDRIATDTFAIVREHEFDGIVIDLELSTLPFDDVVESINEFVETIAGRARAQDLFVGMTMYGDVFYRKRPFDIVRLSSQVDEIMIMAYDFHKAGGEPGPNFPLKGKEKYGYDYEMLMNDFSVVPSEKLSVIFGMYGYDWTVDEKKKPIKPAKALSLNDIEKEFVRNCTWKNCTILRDKVSRESEVNYIDTNLFYHIVWFEDEESTEAKHQFLKEKGIDNIIYWTYGYF
jgi:spore germination protein